MATLTEQIAKINDTRDVALVKLANVHFSKGGTLSELAEAFGKSEVTVRKHLAELGVEVPVLKRGAKSRFTEEQKAQIAQAWTEASAVERLHLAAQHEVNPATMRGWAVERGLFEPKPRQVEQVQESEVVAA